MQQCWNLDHSTKLSGVDLLCFTAPSKQTCKSYFSKKERIEQTWKMKDFSSIFSNVADNHRCTCAWDPCLFTSSMTPLPKHLIPFHENSWMSYQTTIKKWNLIKNCEKYTSCSVFSAGKRALSPETIKRINGKLIKIKGGGEKRFVNKREHTCGPRMQLNMTAPLELPPWPNSKW